MARISLIILPIVAGIFICLLSSCAADGHHHKKVIIHVPYKIHTIHHHSVKKIPVYHYYDHHDHHHHHHHHEHHEEKDEHSGEEYWD
uniref:Histidine-rich glycoprotein n=2 Tax=Rhodnius prolixus TaxID=13249 RepID=A0A4P6DAG2_RHOPR